MYDKTHNNYQNYFKTHKATLIQDTERYLAIDWRKTNGSSEFYVNYVFDKKCGSLIISGDLGYCIATWHNVLDVTKLKSLIKDAPYFVKKIQCSTDKYVYDENDILADIREIIEQHDIDRFIANNNDECENADEFWKIIENEINNSRCTNTFLPTDRLVEIISEIDPDYYYEWLYRCGQRIDARVYLWIVGFQMACDQLGL